MNQSLSIPAFHVGHRVQTLQWIRICLVEVMTLLILDIDGDGVLNMDNKKATITTTITTITTITSIITSKQTTVSTSNLCN